MLIQLKRRDLMEVIQQDDLLAKTCRPVDERTILVPTARLMGFRKRSKELGYLIEGVHNRVIYFSMAD